MQPEITLKFNDGGGERCAVVHSKRFSIGRSPENDLTIDSSSLSRRHAVIENFDGLAQISDCSSQNGTEVNGRPVTAGTVLQDGDVIRFGGVWEVVVQINTRADQPDAQSPPPVVTAGVGTHRAMAAFNQPVRHGPGKPTGPVTASWLSVPVIAAAGVVLILLVIGVVVLVSKLGGSHTPSRRKVIATDLNTNTQPQFENNNAALPQESDTRVDDSSGGVASEMVEKAATQVMHRVSSDDKTYSFSEKAVHDIQRKVAEYRGAPSLAASLGALQQTSPALAAQARQQGIEPGLLIYAALAHTDGGHDGDPAAAARAILPNILALRATFGTNDADSSLILIAAFKIGGGEKKSHPLLVIIRRLVKNPLTQRNIWFLHDSGGLKAETYDFVIKFLALGVISQAPRQFGIAADPLSF